MDTWKINEWKWKYIYTTVTLLILWSFSFMVRALHPTPWICLSLEGNNSAGCQEISITAWNQKVHVYWINVHQLVTDSPSPYFNVDTTPLRNVMFWWPFGGHLCSWLSAICCWVVSDISGVCGLLDCLYSEDRDIKSLHNIVYSPASTVTF